MKLIPLTKGYSAMVDDDDYENVIKYKWSAHVLSHTVYGIHDFRNKARTKGKQIFLHSFILPPPEGFTVDHIDRNGLNCQKGNLRFATPSQQSANVLKPNSYRGVFLKGNGYQALLTYKGKQRYGGSWPTKIEAAKAYDRMAIHYHKEFAILNFPDKTKSNFNMGQ